MKHKGKSVTSLEAQWQKEEEERKRIKEEKIKKEEEEQRLAEEERRAVEEEIERKVCMINLNYAWRFIAPCAAELFAFFCIHLKLKLLRQFPASNDEKYLWYEN